MTHADYIDRQAAMLTQLPPMVVGFAGYSGSGKDTAAQALLNGDDGRQWVRIGIGDAIREALEAIDPPLELGDILGVSSLSEAVARNGWNAVHRWHLVRGWLEALGRWGRSVSTDFWLDIAVRKVRAAVDAGKSVVVPDVRIESEAWSLVDNFNAKVIKVIREGVKPLKGGAEDNTWLRDHWVVRVGGERVAAPDIAVLHNDSTPEALQAKVRDVLSASIGGD